MKNIKNDLDRLSGGNLLATVDYYRIDLPEFPGIVFEKENEDQSVVTRLYIYLDGSVSKMFYIVNEEKWEPSGSILYMELLAIYELHKEMNV